MEIGFSEREAKVYLALLERRCASSADLQKSSGIPQTKVYEIARGLVRHGYCRERKLTGKCRYEVVDPQMALAPLIQKLEERLKDACRLRTELAALYLTPENEAEESEYIEVLHGEENLIHNLHQLLQNAHQELLIFAGSSGSYNNLKTIHDLIREHDNFLARGGITRLLFDEESAGLDWAFQALTILQNKGVHIRIAKCLPLKLIIADSSVVLIAQVDQQADPHAQAATIIKQCNLARAYGTLFDFFWEHATELAIWKVGADRTS